MPLDSDQDGIIDAEEQALAERFAPIIFHDPEEVNLPSNVDLHLSQTSLFFYDDACDPDLVEPVPGPLSQQTLVSQVHGPSCGSGDPIRSYGSRSARKQRTYFLADVSEAERAGSRNPADWTTYYHAYPNDSGGVTIQYWRLYAYNSGSSVLGVQFGFHGGDWEAVHVVLDAALSPIRVDLLGHRDITPAPWSAVEREGEHPVIYSAKGGHSSLIRGSRAGIRQETWTSPQRGQVIWPGRGVFACGALINLGEKTAPMNGQVFIRYSGLWGSPGFLYESSGYWGPAYNETAMEADGFISAWGRGIRNRNFERDGIRECFPTWVSR